MEFVIIAIALALLGVFGFALAGAAGKPTPRPPVEPDYHELRRQQLEADVDSFR